MELWWLLGLTAVALLLAGITAGLNRITGTSSHFQQADMGIAVSGATNAAVPPPG